MLQRSLAALSVTALLASGASAQQPPATAAQKPAESQAAQAPPRPQPQLVNVKIDLTITDQREGAASTAKTLTMIVADRESGRIRSTSAREELTLNVDVRPELVREGRVRTWLTLEYRPPRTSPDKEAVGMTESLVTILDDGKPLVVSQSADPASSRSVRVELKATILK